MPRFYGQNVTRKALHQFRRDEDGSFVLFGLFLFVAMLIVGGLSVDILRQDYARTKMQNAIDNAVLAAADLDQTLNPQDVVTDYLTKAGVASSLKGVEVSAAPNSRVVTANTSVSVPTMFMSPVGVDAFNAFTSSTAREDIRDVEISLVLDVSSSMYNSDKIGKLKTAAKSFARKLLIAPDGSQIQGRISINIVPYSTQVNAGDTLLDAMNITDRHTYSNCVDFAGSDYGDANMSGGDSYRQTPFFDNRKPATNDPYDERHGTYAGPEVSWGVANSEIICRTDSASEITLYEDNLATLEDRIDDLWPLGNTSIEIGLKWGAGLLDPQMQDVYETVGIDGAFSDRPYPYDEQNTMKIVVMMTDGANTTSWSLDPTYSGDRESNVWRYKDGSTWLHSVSDGETYWRNDGDQYNGEEYYRVETRNYSYNPRGGNQATRLTWQELWSAATIGWHAYWARAIPYNSQEQYDDWLGIVQDTGPSTKNTRQESLCTDIKSKGIIIFSVAFEISEFDASRMKTCASTENHYFNVTGDQIVYAFNSIATTINQLKLTR